MTASLSSTIAEMRELLAKATPGEWAAERDDEEDGRINHSIWSLKPWQFLFTLYGGISRRGKQDAEFIAAAHNAMPALLDALERRTEALRWTLDQLRELMAFHDSKTKPCGEYGAECPIAMGEWFDKLEREAFDVARSALGETK